MAGVRELDTLGAWLLERLVRSCVQRKIEVQFLGLPDRYRGLFDQVSRVNRRTGEPAVAKIYSWRALNESVNQRAALC